MHGNQNSPKEKAAFIVGLIFIVLAVYFSFYKTMGDKKDKQAYLENEEGPNYVIPKISTKEVKSMITRGNAVIFLDIREETDFAKEHIIDSISIDPQKNLSNQDLGKLGENKEINFIVIGYLDNAKKNSETIDSIKNNGYKNVFLLNGGIEGWRNENGQIITYGDPNSFTSQSKVTFISAEELKKLLETNYPCYVLDVRQPELYKLEHIKGAANIPIQDLEKKRKDLPVSMEIFVYSWNDLESFQAGVRLFDLGLFNARVLSKGFTSWKSKNFEVVK